MQARCKLCMLSRYVSHTFNLFNYANMQTLRVEIWIYDIALSALFILDYLNEMKCMLSVVLFNVFRIGPIIEPEKLPIHNSLVRPTIKLRSNR